MQVIHYDYVFIFRAPLKIRGGQYGNNNLGLRLARSARCPELRRNGAEERT